jgi:hypothetical protein
MARKLARTVHVTDPETRRLVTLVAGTVPPSEYADLITNEQAWEPEQVDEDVADAADDGPPTKSASKADWKAYAIAQGMDEAEADDMTRDDLAELYLGG